MSIAFVSTMLHVCDENHTKRIEMCHMLYDILKRVVSFFFNTLNVLLGGKLPPFGSAVAIVEEQGRYLVVELPHERVVFPGGFMTWREDARSTAQREVQEETGLCVRVGDIVGTYSCASDRLTNMSTISCVYAAKVVGGTLHSSCEGRPCWMHEKELRMRLSEHSRGILDDYLCHCVQQNENKEMLALAEELLPLPENHKVHILVA